MHRDGLGGQYGVDDVGFAAVPDSYSTAVVGRSSTFGYYLYLTELQFSHFWETLLERELNANKYTIIRARSRDTFF